MGVILVVDDDAGIRENVERILTAEGHTIINAEDGDQGLYSAIRDQPDIVLTDLSMPGRDGRSLSQALRDDPRTNDIRIIAMSAGPSLYESIGLLRVDSVIAKPFTSHILVANVALQLQKRRTARIAAGG